MGEMALQQVQEDLLSAVFRVFMCGRRACMTRSLWGSCSVNFSHADLLHVAGAGGQRGPGVPAHGLRVVAVRRRHGPRQGLQALHRLVRARRPHHGSGLKPAPIGPEALVSPRYVVQLIIWFRFP
jgi:hypothetical protein